MQRPRLPPRLPRPRTRRWSWRAAWRNGFRSARSSLASQRGKAWKKFGSHSVQSTVMRNLWLVVNLNVVLRFLEKMRIVGSTSLTTSETDLLINCTWPSPNVSSGCIFYDWLYPSLSATHCLTHTLSLSLCCLALFPILIIWYKNPGIHFHVFINHKKLFEYTLLFHWEVSYNTVDLLALTNSDQLILRKQFLFVYFSFDLMILIELPEIGIW